MKKVIKIVGKLGGSYLVVNSVVWMLIGMGRYLNDATSKPRFASTHEILMSNIYQALDGYKKAYEVFK